MTAAVLKLPTPDPVFALADGVSEPWFDRKAAATGGYYPCNLNDVPWYARLRFEQRLAYLDWVIAKRQAELDARGVAADNEDARRVAAFNWTTRRLAATLSQIRRQRIIELSDREPSLPDWHDQGHRSYYHSGRWRRIRLRKLVSVKHRCEQPGCKRSATVCHHKHYDTFGFEENDDLEALCSRHHWARHSNGQGPRRAELTEIHKEVWPPALGPPGDDVFDLRAAL
jgi:hypothetical protein